MSDLIPFDFHGDQLLLADVDGKPFVIFRRVVEALGLDYSTQLAKLRNRSWANRRDIPTVGADGRTRQMAAISVPTMLMWLATVNETRVADAVRPKLIAYQSESSDAVYQYWTRGGVINPRASVDQLDELRGQAAVLEALRNVVDPGWLDAKGRILAARALGDTPQLDQSTKPLTVSIYLAGRGVKGKQAKAVAPMFGKRLKALYVQTFGEEPASIEDVVGRHTVRVAQYQEQHRTLFDQVWSQHFSGVAS